MSSSSKRGRKRAREKQQEYRAEVKERREVAEAEAALWDEFFTWRVNTFGESIWAGSGCRMQLNHIAPESDRCIMPTWALFDGTVQAWMGKQLGNQYIFDNDSPEDIAKREQAFLEMEAEEMRREAEAREAAEGEGEEKADQ
jgi:hypothetical protein